MKQLFNRMIKCDSGANIEKQGDLMVARFRKQGKSKNIMAAEEIQALINERDEALEKASSDLHYPNMYSLSPIIYFLVTR